MATKKDPQKIALQALAKAVVDPAPKPLFGTAKNPGIFTGQAQSTKEAAALCERNGWVESTGDFRGTGKSKKALYAITSAGRRAAIEHSEPAELLREMLSAIDRKRESVQSLKEQIQNLGHLIGQQNEVLQEMLQNVVPPHLEAILTQAESGSCGDSSTDKAVADGWVDKAIAYLRSYQNRNPYGHCSLPELYHQVAEPAGLSIGQFHDGLRRLASEGRVQLHPYTGPAYQLQEEQYALLAGQEIKYYVQCRE